MYGGNYNSRDRELIDESLAIALPNIKHVKSYLVHPSPSASRAVYDVMDSNQVQLDHLVFVVDNADRITETFTTLQAARSVSSVSSLKIKCLIGVDHLLVNQRLADLCSRLGCLSSLKLTCYYGQEVFTLLADIIQRLTTLQCLEYHFEKLQGGIWDNTIQSRAPTTHANRVESTKFTSVVSEVDDSMEKLNTILRFMLQSCPNLKTFDFCGLDISFPRGVIDLDFRGNRFLRQIQLNMPRCRYYTFAHKPGKYWSDIDKEIIMQQGDLTLMQGLEEVIAPYHINLAWDTTQYQIAIETRRDRLSSF